METDKLDTLTSEVRNKSFFSSTPRNTLREKSSGGGSDTIPGAQPEKLLNDTQAEAIAQRVNDFLESVQTDLRVEIHRETHKAIFRIVRKEDQKIIQEIPPRTLLDIEANINKMIGSFLNLNA